MHRVVRCTSYQISTHARTLALNNISFRTLRTERHFKNPITCLAEALQEKTNVLPVQASNVSIISGPFDFYSALVKCISNATSRVSVASLYLGTGTHERGLITALFGVFEKRPNLQCDFIFDFNRGTRGGRDSTLSLLLPLVQKYPQNIRVYFFRIEHESVIKRHLLERLPERYNETLGTFHLKSYCFDDSTILSGANLSKDYFSNRQVF